MSTHETQFSIFPEGDDLNDILNMTRSGRLTPSFFVYKKNGEVEQIQILEEGILKIGKGDSCDVVLDDPSVSDVQVSVIRLADECIFMDSGANDVVQFNGIKCRQMVMPSETRVVMKIGNSWVVYVGIDYHVYDETDSVLLRRALYKPSDETLGDILLQCGDLEWYSNESPVLVGSHNACDFRIEGNNVKPFHCFIYFAPEGLFIEDLTKSKPGIKVNGAPAIGVYPINEDATLSIGDKEVFLYVYDDVKGQCNNLFRTLNRTPGLVLKDIQNPDTPKFPLEASRNKLTVGREEGCDILLDDTSVSRKHAFVQAREKCLHIMDNQSSNKCHINLQPVDKATAIPGDIIGFGSMKFLLYYQQ